MVSQAPDTAPLSPRTLHNQNCQKKSLAPPRDAGFGSIRPNPTAALIVLFSITNGSAVRWERRATNEA